MREIILTILLASTVAQVANAAGAPSSSIRCPSTCTPSSEFPLTAHHTGHIVVGQSSAHACYGTLVSPAGHVLTAGHCVVTNKENALSAFQSSVRLRMYDCCEMDLRLVHFNALYDSALLLAPSEAAQRYGWADIERVSLDGLLNGAELLRAGHGTACGVAPDSNKLDWALTCGSKPGDSGEALLLPNGKIAGHITSGTIVGTLKASSFGRSLGNSFATTSFPTYFYNLAFGAPLPFVGEGGGRDPIRLGDTLEFTVSVYNGEIMGASPGGELIISFDPPSDSVDCTVTPPQAATVAVHYPGEVVPTMAGDTTVLTTKVVVVRSALRWEPGERRDFTCRIVPTSLGPVKIRYRAALDWLDATHQFGDPREAPERDEQEWPVRTRQIDVIDPAAILWTGPAYAIDSESATLSGDSTFNIGWGTIAGAYYEYGQTSSYGSTTPHGEGQSIPDSVVTGLDCGTEYHYRVVLQVNRPEGLETIVGNDRTFKTLPCNRPIRDLSAINAGACGTYVSLNSRISISDNPAVLVWTAGLCILGNCTPETSFTRMSFGLPALNGLPPFRLEGLACGRTYLVRLTAYSDNNTPLCTVDPQGPLPTCPELTVETQPCGLPVTNCRD
jgi:hypothetical protein